MKDKLKFRRINRQSGFSIIEMIVAIAIFSVLLLISADSFWKASQSLKDHEKFVTRSRIFQNLIYMMGLPSATRAAIENAGPNSEILICVRGVPSFNCDTGVRHPIVLFLPPVTTDGVSVITSGPISGPPAAPLQYSLEGKACSGTCPPAEFPISVSTEFEGICPPAYDFAAYPPWVLGTPINPAGLQVPGQCWNAHYIKIIYRFETTIGAPPELYFPPMTGSIYISAVSMRWAR